MKTIYLVRHAKAELRRDGKPDEMRRLLVKGEVNTKFVCDYLRAHKIRTDMIITSHVVRAVETANMIASALRYPEDNIKIDSHIYFSGVSSLFNQFYDISDFARSVMIIGHNPSITSFVNYFIKDQIDNLPTSGLIGISFDINKWHRLDKAEGTEILRVFPKTIKKIIKCGALAMSNETIRQ